MRVEPDMIKELLRLKILGSTGWFETGNKSISDFAPLLIALIHDSHGKKAERNSDLPPKDTLSLPLSGALWAKGDVTAGMRAMIPYDSLIEKASQKYGVDAGLLKAVIHAESGFDPHAVSRSGAKGLMQLMDETGRALGVEDPFDPEQNIDGGTRYLSELLKKYKGNEAVALAAYNAGPGRIDRLGITNDAKLYENYGLLPEETQTYVRKVLSLKKVYSYAFGA